MLGEVSAGTDSGEIRVLQVTANFFPAIGGIETHVYETTRRLNRMAGIRVDVLTTDRTGTRPRTDMVEGTRVRRVRAWPVNRDYYVAPRIRTVINSGYYDLIHCQGAHTAVPLIAMAAARSAGLPFIVTTHTGGHSSQLRHGFRDLQWTAIGPLLRQARRLICVAEFERDLFTRTTRISADRVVVIPNGISIGAPSDGAKPDPENPTVVCVGRFERYKGQQHLVAAMPRLLDLVPAARLVLVGAGPSEDELRRQAAELAVADRVTFTHIPPADRGAMSDLIATANVVALLSDYEAHPLAVMEALALGRPVLVTPNAGLGELARNGLAESVEDPRDSGEVARALARKIAAPTAGTGAEAGVDLPTWETCAGRLAEIYRESA